ncbi:T9SS type A sorting domain-containing protein [Hymenobacter sp. BT664]|uniref:T9SS type A sorting domain-containing protein n=1 Tax=Hymenobacter montanus TaxID=2771359 RepID=A0A927BER8_9BACT|nr:T9SS type A sorting domain-containing protein [Hymenobacter montanus]MBD2769521.1 T9SS type A sorting domain-containing protein [Hymenobacter montanus]
MKSIFHPLLALAAVVGLLAPAQAQTFPNNSFDTWATRNGAEAPDGWRTTDDVIQDSLRIRLITNTVVKTNVVQSASGPFAAQLQTKSLLGQTIPGIVILGPTTKRRAQVPGGIPFTGRPAALEFYYQLSGAEALANKPAALVQLTRWVNGRTQVVANAGYYFTTLTNTYTRVYLGLNYQSALVPDSVSIVFISGSVQPLSTSTVLRIDQVSFTGTATATRDAALAGTISAAPNPSPSGRYVLSSPEASLLAGPLAVRDALGREVHREDAPRLAATSRTLDLSELPAGLYTVQLFTPRGLVTRKLVR